MLQHGTILLSAQPSRQDSSNASSSAEGTNNEAGSVRAADATSSRASLDNGAGDMPDEIAIVPNGNGSIETAGGEAFQSSQPAQPPDETAPLLSGLQKALAAALLVSPFFFWGTSMVGMKVSVSIILSTALATVASLLQLLAQLHALQLIWKEQLHPMPGLSVLSGPRRWRRTPARCS